MPHPFPNLLAGQVAVVYAEHATGITLSLDGRWNNDPVSSPYHIFSTEQEAMQAAQWFLHHHPRAEARIYDAKQKTLRRIIPHDHGENA